VDAETSMPIVTIFLCWKRSFFKKRIY